MKIDISLSSGDLLGAAKKLRDYANSIETKSKELVQKLGDAGVEYANLYLEHDDTGETRNSLQYTQDGLTGTLGVGGAAVWIEFGTGVLANAGNSPHPKRDELGMSAWGTYGKGLGVDIWEFPSKHASGMWLPTAGIHMNPFMYETSQSLRFILTDFAKEVFKT